MAVAIDLDFDGGTLEQYDEVARLMDYEPGGAAPPGCLFHWGTLTDRGLRITDVWETKEQFEQYAKEAIGTVLGAGWHPRTAADHVLRRAQLPGRVCSDQLDPGAG
jgi:hypothetical protein